MAAAESTDVQYQAQIARAVTTHVDRVMTSRGFEFSDREPDLLVQPEVRIRRRHWTIHTAVVDQFLPSLHFTPSYQIEGMTVAEPRTIESARLRIVVVDRARGIIVWSGELRGDSEQSFASRVESSVETVMARFPIAADRPDDMMARPIVAQAGTRPGEGQR